MLTGRQIREARLLIGMDPGCLARRTKIFKATILRAEMVDGVAPLTTADAASIQRSLERAGVEFTSEGARLRKDQP